MCSYFKNSDISNPLIHLRMNIAMQRLIQVYKMRWTIVFQKPNLLAAC